MDPGPSGIAFEAAVADVQGKRVIEERAMPRIMVATDGSPGANRAVDTAAKLAKVTRSDLVILTIDGSFSGTELKRLTSIDGDLRKRLESNTHQILEHAQKRVRRHGITAAELQSGSGDPAQAIIGAIRGKSDILVVGRRGRSHLSGVLLGSVSQKLTTLAPCSVMVVP